MFTGIINGQGKVLAVESRGHETRFRIQALYDLADIILGESIAVNGTCLTVETSGPSLFSAYASAETMQRTALGLLKPGAKVNLERALAVGDRLGGHIVSGHVDCVAEILSVRREGESRRIRIGFPASFGAEVIGKGSVALDGISLTVNDCGPDFLEVNVIPETWRATTVAEWAPGTRINMETDVIGKYVRKVQFDELMQTLNLPIDELKKFAADVLERFDNPYVEHQVTSIMLNSFPKYQTRDLPGLKTYLERKGELPKGLVLGLAAIITYYKGGVRADGAEIIPNDAPEIMQLLKDLWATGDTRKVAEGVLAAKDLIWGEHGDLNTIPGLTDMVTDFLNSIQAKGMLETVKGIL